MHGERGMCGRGVYGGGHAWQGWGTCGRGGMHGGGWGEGGSEHAWQERQPLQQTVCMLLECILVDDGYGPIVYLDLH